MISVEGYAVFSRTPNMQQVSGFDYQLVSSVFLDSAQADNALTYCNSKRKVGDLTDYILRQINVIERPANART